MIDTNLIIGRLGSGKTSCILHLLQNKPENENWAVIVNEFGQIGIDAALLEPESTNNLSIKEIAGGCICCAAKTQLHVTLTTLIRQHRPDRILIEATGLGHPAGIVDLLRDEYLHKVININSIINVIDLTLFNNTDEISGQRSAVNTEIFLHQNQLADIVVLNKSDLVSETCIEKSNKYLHNIYPKKKKIISTTKAKIDLKWLTLISDISHKETIRTETSNNIQTRTETITYLNTTVECFFSDYENLVSFGYILPANIIFDRKKTQDFLNTITTDLQLNIIRLKAVLNCGRFWYGFNGVAQKLDTAESFYRRDNRIEFIIPADSFEMESLRDNLFSCIDKT